MVTKPTRSASKKAPDKVAELPKPTIMKIGGAEFALSADLSPAQLGAIVKSALEANQGQPTIEVPVVQPAKAVIQPSPVVAPVKVEEPKVPQAVVASAVTPKAIVAPKPPVVAPIVAPKPPTGPVCSNVAHPDLKRRCTSGVAPSKKPDGSFFKLCDPCDQAWKKENGVPIILTATTRPLGPNESPCRSCGKPFVPGKSAAGKPHENCPECFGRYMRRNGFIKCKNIDCTSGETPKQRADGSFHQFCDPCAHGTKASHERQCRGQRNSVNCTNFFDARKNPNQELCKQCEEGRVAVHLSKQQDPKHIGTPVLKPKGIQERLREAYELDELEVKFPGATADEIQGTSRFVIRHDGVSYTYENKTLAKKLAARAAQSTNPKSNDKKDVVPQNGKAKAPSKEERATLIASKNLSN